MTNKIKSILPGSLCAVVMLLVSAPVLVHSQTAASKEISASSAGISPDHPEVEAGMSCVDCHSVTLDAQTTATKAWLSGDYLKFTAGEGIMPPEDLKKEIVAIIGGRKHNRTFVLGTCINNTPLTTTADFMLDPQTMTIYGLHEKGTTKLFHIQQNPRVSLNWHEEFETWGKVMCMQFIGHAVLLEGSDPEFEQVLNDCIPYEQLAAAMKIEPAQARGMIKAGMLMSKIRVDMITVNNSAFELKGLRKYQRWERSVAPAKTTIQE
jgi:hypothetical protein